MEYNRIIAITGLGGLFELLSSKSDGAIVRSLEDKQTRFVSSRVHNFSHLESIEVYTVRENINLVDLFKAMQESKAALPEEKDAAAVRAFFEKVYPELDFERIYNSDMKKMVRWYSLLNSHDVEFKLPEPAEAEGEAEEEEVTVEAEAAPAKKAAPKAKAAATTTAAPKAEATKPATAKPEAAKAPASKTETPKAAASKAAPAEEAPAPKKKAAKPATDEGEKKPAKKK